MSTTENTEEKEQDIVVQGVHNYSAAETYCRPEEPILQEKLEWFQDQKLALMMHWGLYCELGMVASWALSDKDADCPATRSTGPTTERLSRNSISV